MSYPKFAFLTLPYARRELPGWGKLLQKLGVLGDSEELWKDAPTITTRGKWHGYLMTLDLSHWEERLSYFLGRFYDLPVQLVIQALLQPGDCCIDIGANIGMLTLMAAHCVGSKGIVHAFEPNPIAFERLQAVCANNQLHQVTLHQCGLSDQQDELTLSVTKGLTVLGTFAKIPQKEQPLITNQYKVPVYCGDDILPNDLPEVALIKTDTEGFDTSVLRGLSRTIRRFRPVIVTEVIASQLERASSSVEELWAVMHDYGYEPFSMVEAKHFGWDYHLQLRKVTDGKSKMTKNVVWLHPQSNRFARLEQWIVP